jgi:uncharacterized protein (DUF2461 family)
LELARIGPQANLSPFQQGYEHDNENIELLRLRSFTIGKPVSDTDLLSPDAQEKIATLIGIMEPFVSNPFTFICSQILSPASPAACAQ